MIKLRTILLFDYLYYLIFLFSILYTIYIINNTVVYPISETTFNVVVDDFYYKNDKTYIVSNKNNTQLIYKGYIDLKLGSTLIVSGREIEISTNTNFNLFNYKEYLFSIGIQHLFEIDNYSIVDKNPSLLLKIKQYIINKINTYDKLSPYLHAFILGDTSYIDEDILNTYRKNGISHLFAVSGMHISFITVFLLSILKKIKINEDNRYYIVIIFLFFYMFLCGFTKSVMRSSFLFILLSINKIFYFHIKTINILLIVISILLFLNPFNIYNIGFLYSTIISFFLIVSSKNIEELDKIKSVIYISTIAFFSSLPISLYTFFEINFLSIIINIFFVPIVSIIIFPLTVISFFIPFLEYLTYPIIYIFNILSNLVSEISVFTFIFSKPNLYLIFIYYILLFLILIKPKMHFKIIYILLLFVHYNNFFITQNYMIMLDVGQGNCILIVKDNIVILYDVRGGYIRNITAQNIIIPVIKSLGIKKIDHLILSHGDADHIKDAYYLLNNFNVNNIYLNKGELNDFENEVYEYAKTNHINISRTFSDNISLLFLNNTDYNDENDNSIVVYILINNYKILLMGDVSIPVSHDIMNKYNIKDIDILLLSHHGSKNSSDELFLKHVNPKISLISVGYNTFNHPSNEVIDILESNKMIYFRVDIDKSIRINFDKKINIEFIR